jgi:hypothetical protein
MRNERYHRVKVGVNQRALRQLLKHAAAAFVRGRYLTTAGKIAGAAGR